jgi:hypothetical protein
MFQYNLNQITQNEKDLKLVIHHVAKMIQLNKLFFAVCCILYLILAWRVVFPFCDQKDFVHVYYHHQIKMSEIVSILLGFSILLTGAKYVHQSFHELVIYDVPKQLQTLTMFFYGYSTLSLVIAHIPSLFTYCHECKIDNEMKKFANNIGFDLNTKTENGITNNQFIDLFHKHFSNCENLHTDQHEFPKVDCELTTKESDDAIHLKLKCVQAQNQWQYIVREMERVITPMNETEIPIHKNTEQNYVSNSDHAHQIGAIRTGIYSEQELKNKLQIPNNPNTEVIAVLKTLPNWKVAETLSQL